MLSSEEKTALYALADPLCEQVFIHSETKNGDAGDKFISALDSLLPGWRFVVDVSFLPGVLDTAGAVAARILQAGGLEKSVAVHSSRLWLAKDEQNARDIADNHANPLLHAVRIHTRADFLQEGGPKSRFQIPAVTLADSNRVQRVNLNISDSELAALGREGILDDETNERRGPLGLSPDDLRAVRDHFAAKNTRPTDAELETLAQTWSEHCRHRTFAAPLAEAENGILRHFIRRATEDIIARDRFGAAAFVVSAFHDNSGAVALDADHILTDKVETHNSPSALDPFAGALTGILGVNRDCIGFGLGAQPVANRYGFCLPPCAENDSEKETRLFRDDKKTSRLPAPRAMRSGVVAGIERGGNCAGIPTMQGFTRYHDSWRGKPLVFCGTLGVAPRRLADGRAVHEKRARAGDIIVMAGGRVGADGIHGATFSSASLDEGSPAGAVQLGDPFTQRKLGDALLRELRDLGVYSSVTDNGAGGLSSSVGEMARESGGAEVRLERVARKYPGLPPWAVWVSESQERMTLAVRPDRLAETLAVFARYETEAWAIGHFSDSGVLRLKYEDETVGELDLKFLHDGAPSLKLKAGEEATATVTGAAKLKVGDGRSIAREWAALMRRPNLRAHGWIARRYDHTVRGGFLYGPLCGAARMGISAFCPTAGRDAAAVLAQSLLPEVGRFSAYEMAAAAVETAARHIVAAGVTRGRVALLDNFCWPDNGGAALAALLAAARGCFDAATALDVPFISGKDSMHNRFDGFDENGAATEIASLPTLLISSLGVLDHRDELISPEFKRAGDVVYVLGASEGGRLGGSEYAAMAGLADGETGGVAAVNLGASDVLFSAFGEARRLAASALALEGGGLAAGLTRGCLGSGFGVSCDLSYFAESVAGLLFCETSGRILCTVEESGCAEFENVMSRHGVEFSRLGEVIGDAEIRVRADEVDVKLSLADLCEEGLPLPVPPLSSSLNNDDDDNFNFCGQRPRASVGVSRLSDRLKSLKSTLTNAKGLFFGDSRSAASGISGRGLQTSHSVGSSEQHPLSPAGAACKKIKLVPSIKGTKTDDHHGGKSLSKSLSKALTSPSPSSSSVQVNILSGLGLNCEDETQYAFRLASARANLIQISDFLQNPEAVLNSTHIFVIPGGFSFADDTGAGNALATLLRNQAGKPLAEFITGGGLVLGVCNGCQVLLRLGLVGDGAVSLAPNASRKYESRASFVKVSRTGVAAQSPWLTNADKKLLLPVAHGEGRFIAASETWNNLTDNGQIALQYALPRADKLAEGEYPHNPNGSPRDAAALLDATGRVLAMMPHPERAALFRQRHDWTTVAAGLKRDGKPAPERGDGFNFFAAAVSHCGRSRRANYGQG
ncbi:MAG: phosphoribosylformylglycinamidine synthase subunit PurQ [Alphaproteobacteria bacterium]|nr:phosphoribosylformylglycinamidine synthase subunit PurQ [Alphaproteobacteria bacterium]